MRKRSVFGMAIVVAFVSLWYGGFAFASVTSRHLVRDHQTTTQMLWNDSRAYLVVGMRRDGWSGTQAEYLWQVVAGLFGNPFQFKESRTWLVMATIESKRVNQVTQDGEMFRLRCRTFRRRDLQPVRTR